MKNRPGLTKIYKIIPVALLIIMLFSTIAYGEVDIQTDQQEDSVMVVVKNVGEKPVYLLNALTILDGNGNTVYNSEDISSAQVLKIIQGVSYTFEWDTDDIPEGTYTGKIFEGDDTRTLRAISTNFVIKPRPARPRFYTNKISYSFGKKVDVTFRNTGKETIYTNVNNWKITNLDTGKVVDTLSQDCTFGYGGCADLFVPLRFMQKVKQTWDQKDSSGNQVVPGRYKVTTEYSNNPSGSDSKTISTKTFFIRPRRSSGENEDDKN